MEVYELADGRVYEIMQPKVWPEMYIVNKRRYYPNGSYSQYVMFIGVYSECRKYVEKRKEEARHGKESIQLQI